VFNAATKTLVVSGILSFRTLSEITTTLTISSNTINLNVTSGSVFYVDVTDNIGTINITGTTPTTTGITLVTEGDGTPRSINWGTIKWPGGLAPNYTSTNGKFDFYSLITIDSGVTWFGFVGGQNY
jgi:hypothetical protein